MTLLLSDADVEQVVTMKDCISALEDAFRDMGQGTVVNATRRDSFMASARPDAYYSFKTMEGGLERLGVMAQRINSDLLTYPEVEGFPRRVKIPAAPGNRYVGLVFLYSSSTLELLAIITDGHLQRMRVAGSSGVGIKHLAREDSKVAALFGSGWQAEAAAWALAAVRNLSSIRVFSPNPEHRKSFAEKVASTLKIEVSPAGNPKEAIQGSDIVAVATNAHGPAVVRAEWIRPGMHLTSILPTDFDEQCWNMSDVVITSGDMGPQGRRSFMTGNPKISSFRTDDFGVGVEVERMKRFKDKIYLLSDLLVGKAPGRTGSSQITMLNKNWGLGIEFASVAKLVYDRARAAGIGVEIPTERFSQTSHP
jgi:alanine dehydrogenase